MLRRIFSRKGTNAEVDLPLVSDEHVRKELRRTEKTNEERFWALEIQRLEQPDMESRPED